MGKKINIRPQTDVYSTYKRLKYEHWSALSEFVDNSTQSFFDHKKELMDTKYYKGLKVEISYVEDTINGNYLTIYDNAYGMDWTDFVRAINLHKPPRNTNGRNEFGMGLKTAACWYGNCWSIETTRLGSDKKYRVEIDVDALEKYKYEEIETEEEFVSIKEHYTLITIKKLNQNITGPRTKYKIKEMLASTYREDIRSGQIDIVFNGEHLHFDEPPIYVEDLGKYKKTWKKDVDFYVPYKDTQLRVYGFIGIRIPASVKAAGFTLLRRGRVIVGGVNNNNYRPSEVFGDSNSYEYQRLIGELHMDDWPVTQTKDAFDWNSNELEDLFIEKLVEISKEYKAKANDIRVREKVSTAEVFNDVIKGLTKPGIIDEIKVNVVEEKKEEIKLEDKQEIPEEIHKNLVEESVDNGNVEEDSFDMVGGNNGVIEFNYHDEHYKFEITLETSSAYSSWLSVTKKDDTLIIHINTRHAFFAPYINKKEFMPLITKITIAMVLAEQNAKISSPDGRIEPDGIRVFMNQFLDEITRRNIIHD